MRINGCNGKVRAQIQIHTDIVHAQIVVAQCQRLLQRLINLHRNTLGLVLSGKTQQILDDSMGALGLFVEFVGVFDSLRPHLTARGQ